MAPIDFEGFLATQTEKQSKYSFRKAKPEERPNNTHGHDRTTHWNEFSDALVEGPLVHTGSSTGAIRTAFQIRYGDIYKISIRYLDHKNRVYYCEARRRTGPRS